MAITRQTGGELLKSWRVQAGKTQRALAEELRIKQGSLCAYETGGRVPHVDIAFRIEKVTKGAIPMRAWAA